MNTLVRYQQLRKPIWAPPAKIFGPVWAILYGLMAASFSEVFLMVIQGRITWTVAMPFILNVFFNVIFMLIQFGLRNNTLALVDILLVSGTLIWAMLAIFPLVWWVAYMQIPYLLWVSFATLLQIEITHMNK